MHRYTVQNTMWHFWSFTSEFSLHAAGWSSQFKALGNSDWFTGCLCRKYSETKHSLVLKRWTPWSKHAYYLFIPTKAETYLGYLGVSWSPSCSHQFSHSTGQSPPDRTWDLGSPHLWDRLGVGRRRRVQQQRRIRLRRWTTTQKNSGTNWEWLDPLSNIGGLTKNGSWPAKVEPPTKRWGFVGPLPESCLETMKFRSCHDICTCVISLFFMWGLQESTLW